MAPTWRTAAARDALRVVPRPGLARKLGLAAAALFALTFLSNTPARYVGPLATGFGFVLPALGALCALGAAAAAAVGGGLLGSLLVAGGPAFGFFLALGAFELTYPSPSVAWGVGTGAAATAVLGVAGFVLGTGVRAGWGAVENPRRN